MQSIPETIVTNANGIKTMTEWFINDEGKRMKRTTKYKLVEAKTMMSRGIVARRNLAPFGKAVSQGNGGGITRVDGETELTVAQKEKELAAEAAFREAWKQRQNASKEKWGVKDYSAKHEKSDFWDKAREGSGMYGEGAEAGPAGAKPGSYVPPAARAGAGTKMVEGSRFGRRDDGNTVRITNLSEEASENDLQELCRNFGAVSRVYLAKDKHTGVSKGFAFINFHNRSDAEKAIATLNGYGYDNLILHVEWAQPSKPREESERPLIGSVGGGRG